MLGSEKPLILQFISPAGFNDFGGVDRYNNLVEELSSVTLVVAHPDDEVMFFSPTLAQFDEMFPRDVPVNVVCMTSGDADGLGHIRKQELIESLQILLHGRKFSCEVLDFEDGIDVVWDQQAVQKQLASSIRDSNPLVLTFDQFGVSGHVNHISCADAVKSLPYLHKLHLRSDQPLYVKYSAFITGIVKLAVGTFYTGIERPRYFVSTLPQYLLSVSAMSLAHASQMVWFRVGWWLFSRFCFINELIPTF
ncbi:unnamed protein product [Kluyveromyces dobzhanskii CBS 2104]|uniref:N-acetylglucosaminylphosphatidylinositol deacetylase n=1 Tax=Kluyveromyces dobzhanskii CBS 2104 TaxID=1427455 RepID=A0A0A8L3H8_9SACH|nr:unnamed protein product [Kluyveromyces dobzhanskii CBS 2104]